MGKIIAQLGFSVRNHLVFPFVATFASLRRREFWGARLLRCLKVEEIKKEFSITCACNSQLGGWNCSNTVALWWTKQKEHVTMAEASGYCLAVQTSRRMQQLQYRSMEPRCNPVKRSNDDYRTCLQSFHLPSVCRRVWGWFFYCWQLRQLLSIWKTVNT